MKVTKVPVFGADQPAMTLTKTSTNRLNGVGDLTAGAVFLAIAAGAPVLPPLLAVMGAVWLAKGAIEVITGR
jgi:hypothetical protein